jgi:hypothetical protein
MYDLPPEARERVEKRVKRRVKFYESLRGYLITNVILWGIWALSGPNLGGGVPWPAFVTFFWGIGIVKDAFDVGILGSNLEDIQEAELQREVERERRKLAEQGYVEGAANDPIARYEKPKRGDVALGDDGELIYGDDEGHQRTASRQ